MRKLSIILAVVILMAFSSCKQENKLSSTQVMMDTVVTITIWDSDNEVLNEALELCKTYEQLFSRTNESSDISAINGTDSIEVSQETCSLISTGLEISEKSNGAFDITVLPLVELWDVQNATKAPDDSDIQTALSKVNYKKISVNGNTVSSSDAKIDLGGIAKGYIADKVCQKLKSLGTTRAIVNLGGNVSLIGDNNGRGYSVGIQKPFALHGESCAKLKLSNKSVVTSGIYERYFESDSKIYHHIIDPKTGYPANNGIASVTVICDSATVADALSTTCLILGYDEGTALAKQYDAETVFVLTNGEILISDGLNIDTNGTIPTITLK